MSDDLVFSDEPVAQPGHGSIPPWRVMIVDDDPGVHEVTKLVMADFEMDGRTLQFTHCYSAAQARQALVNDTETALILLDVVMETEHAGLDLAQEIREVMGNRNVRIVLRTGQPGQAPEEQVIRDYDINDYKEKTDLTRRKMITVFYAALRAYRDLMRIEQACISLRRSIEAISEVYDAQNLRGFASAVLDQVNFLLNLNGEGLCASQVSAYTANATDGQIKVLAATSAYAQLLVNDELSALPPEVQSALQRTFDEKKSHYTDSKYAGYFRTKAGTESMIYMQFPEPIAESAKELLSLFCSNVANAYDKLLCREEMQAAQNASIDILNVAIRTRRGAAPHQVRRVGQIAELLAQKSGANGKTIALLRIACGLYDAGMACVSDLVITKPGPLNPAEWAEVKTHCDEGGTLLSQSALPVHQLAAMLARQHHERWDGTGYPQGIAGEAISLEARIVAIADVLDALVNPTSYRAAWPLQKALDYIRDGSGTQFDPALVAVLSSHKDALEMLYADTPATAGCI